MTGFQRSVISRNKPKTGNIRVKPKKKIALNIQKKI